jgi:CRISP-associated protein Cas1
LAEAAIARCPSRIIVLDGSGSLSFNVMAWLAETVSGNGYGVDAKRVGAQIEALRNQQALAIATLFIRAKIVSSIDTLTRAVEARNPTKFVLCLFHT